MRDVANIALLIIYLAMLAVVVKSSNTSKIASSLGTAFDGSIAVAEQG